MRRALAPPPPEECRAITRWLQRALWDAARTWDPPRRKIVMRLNADFRRLCGMRWTFGTAFTIKCRVLRALWDVVSTHYGSGRL